MSDIDPGGVEQRQRETLKTLQEKVAEREVIGVLEALHASGTLEALAGYVRANWSGTFRNEDDVHHIVAQAVDALCEALDAGKQVREVVPYLYKVARNKADDEYNRRKRERAVAPDCLEARAENVPLVGDTKRAIAVARSLIHRLGGENIQKVMNYILDAVEAGREHLPNTEIADALGLTDVTARQLKKRGFDRLKRIAQEEGYAGEEFELPEIDVRDDESDSDEE
jgi:DNA-directed RNA polymerase specialized sigma24 family protein